jgi:hypothetical protein
MKLRRGQLFLVGFTGLFLAVAALVGPAYLDRRSQPIFEGRRIGDWFSDVCLSADRANRANPELMKRSAAASSAFGRMDSNAIPFLVRMLQTPDADLSSQMILRARNVDSLAPLTRSMILPSEKRRVAATLLPVLQTRSKSSLPHLVEAFQKESDRNTKSVYVTAIAVITRAPPRDLPGNQQTESRDDYARRVIGHARQRHPYVFAKQP